MLLLAVLSFGSLDAPTTKHIVIFVVVFSLSTSEEKERKFNGMNEKYWGSIEIKSIHLKWETAKKEGKKKEEITLRAARSMSVRSKRLK